jgi:hypothetical protein
MRWGSRGAALLKAANPISVMAGHSRSKDGVASARLCPAIHDLLACRKDVDAWDKPGHDDA